MEKQIFVRYGLSDIFIPIEKDNIPKYVKICGVDGEVITESEVYFISMRFQKETK